jgi:MYND finger
MVKPNAEMGGKCEVCDQTAKARCSGCIQAFYCSVEHQRKDWKNHKPVCSPIRVCKNDKIGRYYVATRNIKPGEIVLREAPLIIGPSQVTGPVCVGCLKVTCDTAYKINLWRDSTQKTVRYCAQENFHFFFFNLTQKHILMQA